MHKPTHSTVTSVANLWCPHFVMDLPFKVVKLMWGSHTENGLTKRINWQKSQSVYEVWKWDGGPILKHLKLTLWIMKLITLDHLSNLCKDVRCSHKSTYQRHSILTKCFTKIIWKQPLTKGARPLIIQIRKWLLSRLMLLMSRMKGTWKVVQKCHFSLHSREI